MEVDRKFALTRKKACPALRGVSQANFHEGAQHPQ
jgi:hypothetical protein